MTSPIYLGRLDAEPATAPQRVTPAGTELDSLPPLPPAKQGG
jgi:hypothetical protein